MTAWLPFLCVTLAGKWGSNQIWPRLPFSPGELTQKFMSISSTLLQDSWTIGQTFIKAIQEGLPERGFAQQDSEC